jgi:hypothetical protein
MMIDLHSPFHRLPHNFTFQYVGTRDVEMDYHKLFAVEWTALQRKTGLAALS